MATNFVTYSTHKTRFVFCLTKLRELEIVLDFSGSAEALTGDGY